MNPLVLLSLALIAYVFMYRFYAPRLGRTFGEDATRPTPAILQNDGVDYVPTSPHVLFAHHFSAIAAAGPILGPTIALQYGYLPALLWIVLGSLLIGAVHDYGCLFLSVREQGKSLAEVVRRLLGPQAYLLFVLFVIFNLVLINAVFLHLTAVSLTSVRSLVDLGLPETQTLFRTFLSPRDGSSQAMVGGIASSSALVLTLIAPALGYFLVRRRMKNHWAYPLAAFLCIASVWVGFQYPLALPEISLFGFTIVPLHQWMLLTTIYVLIAAAVPVWLILQPREFVSVQFLYLGIFLLVASAVAAGLQGHTLTAPVLDVAHGELALGPIWPALFITIACGAVSGFHGLVAAGTTSKQIMRETHIRPVGYLGMIGESALALCVTLALAMGISTTDYTSIISGAHPNPVLAFSVGVAGLCEQGLGIPRWLGIVLGLLMVEGFVLDTLDVSVRLNRYLLEEVWSSVFTKVPRVLRAKWTNAFLSIVLMLLLGLGETAQTLWPIFGSSNQLLAALSLIVITLWLVAERKPVWKTALPAVFVSVTTVVSLVYLLMYVYWPQRKYALASLDVIFLILAALFVWRAWVVTVQSKTNPALPSAK